MRQLKAPSAGVPDLRLAGIELEKAGNRIQWNRFLLVTAACLSGAAYTFRNELTDGAVNGLFVSLLVGLGNE